MTRIHHWPGLAQVVAVAIPLGAGIGIGLGIQDEVKGWYKVRHHHTLPWHALRPCKACVLQSTHLSIL
jgi:hypothetical protein